LASVSEAVRQRGAEVIEAARQAGVQPDDPLAILLGKITVLAETVAAAARERQDVAERTLFRAGLVMARQLAVRLDRRTALVVGAAGVLIAVVAGYTGYEIGAARLGPIAVCWQQTGKDVCAPAAWLGAMK